MYSFPKGHPKYWEHHSEETKKKMSESHKRIGAPWMIGRKMSEETKRKISETEKRNPHRSALGKRRPPELIERQRLIMKKRAAEHKHWNYKGGSVGYERRLEVNRRRSQREKNNGGFHTIDEWRILKAQYNWTCPNCKKQEPEIVLTRDHIIPISKGGSSNIENIQPLCKSCNRHKYTAIIKY